MICYEEPNHYNNFRKKSRIDDMELTMADANRNALSITLLSVLFYIVQLA